MPDRTPKSFSVSWEEIHRDSKALAWRLMEKNTWKGIIAVTVGGLIPAAIVAKELGIKLVDTVCVSSYDHQNRHSAQVLKGVDGDGENWLVIDDLVDTGATAQILRKMLPKAHFATLYAKPAGLTTVDTFVTEVSQDTWIYLPWENNDETIGKN